MLLAMVLALNIAGCRTQGGPQTAGTQESAQADTGAGETFEWDDEAGIRTYVLKRWEKFLAGDDDSVPDNNIEQYSRKATARKMAALLESLID